MLTLEQAAKRLGCSVPALEGFIADGYLWVDTIKNRRYISEAAIKLLLEQSLLYSVPPSGATLGR